MFSTSTSRPSSSRSSRISSRRMRFSVSRSAKMGARKISANGAIPASTLSGGSSSSKLVKSTCVAASRLPPRSSMARLKAYEDGYVAVPRNNMCSSRWLSPLVRASS